MVKRLMISLFALSLAAIWLSEANAYSNRRRRSVGVDVASNNPAPADKDEPFVVGVFGLPDDDNEGDNCGEVRGELYCAQSDSSADILECQKATGDSAARVLVLDKDAIKAGAPPNFFTKDEVNFFKRDRGQREQLEGFETRAGSTDPAIFVIDLPTGKKNNAGFHAITDQTLSKWNEGGTFTDDEALRRFVGTWNATAGKFIPDDGFGINGEEFIHKVPGIVPLFGPDLDDLLGETICAAVKHPQVKGNSLKGEYLGLVAFKPLSRSGSLLEVEVLDADVACGLPLYIETLTDGEAAGGGDGGQECLVIDAVSSADAVVFAPAFPEGELRAGEGKFIAAEGTLSDCTGPHCKGSVEVVLDPDVGQQLCEENFPEIEGITFVNFIPINRGGNGDFADYAFTSIIESDVPGLSDEVICGEDVESEIKFSQYGCVPLEEIEGAVIPTCYFGCGTKFPGLLTGGTYEDFLDDIGIGKLNCKAVDSYNFDGEVWDFKPIGTEAGHTLKTIRNDGVVTTLFHSDDCSSMGIARRVNFGEENLVFEDTFKLGAEISLNHYVKDGSFPKPGIGVGGAIDIDIYMCNYESGEPVVLNYLEDPFAVEEGQYFFFFNDYHFSSDYDDFILLGKPVSGF